MLLAGGTRLGPYEVVSSVGAGGMGEVYKARDTRLDRTVAIKVLHPGFGSQPDARQRFEREARAISSLNHPHICTLHDIGQYEAIDYLVMEYLEGESLHARLRRGGLPLEQAVQYGIQMAGALAEAHSQGILHRDIKPANVMLTRNGVKLLDFGLAKLRAPGPQVGAGSTLATISADQTEKGTILGTLQYMAPEQLEARELDARADIFALGLVLYEMAGGRRAFTGETPAALIAQIMRGEYTPLGDAPPAFAHVVERCLATDPANRWHAAVDVKFELEWTAAAPTVPAARPLVSSRRRVLAGWLAGVLVAGIGGGAAWLWRDRAESPPYRFSIPPPPGAEFYRTPNHGGLALSPDGRALVFLAIRNGQSRLWVQALDSTSARELPGTEEATDPFWSPDGRSLGFFAGGSLKRMDLDGSSLQTLCDIRAPRGAAWNANGVILFSPFNSANSALYRIAATGGQPVPVKLPGYGESYRAAPQFLPDGKRFLYFLGGRAAGTYIGSLEDEKLLGRVLPFNSWAQFAQAGPGGPEYLFWHRDGSIVAQRWSSRSFRLSGEPALLGGPVGVLASSASFSVSSAGLLVYAGSSDLQMQWCDRQGKPLGEVGEPGFLVSPRQSPDGRKVAVCKRDALLVTDVARGVTSRIATGASGQNLSWSPDSARIAFSHGGVIVVTNADGGGETSLTGAGRNETADWTPDGRSLLYVDRNPETRHRVWIVPAAPPGKARLLLDLNYDQAKASLSPDGHWLAYSNDESGRPEVYVQNIDSLPAGRRTQISGGGGDFPQWRSDGRELFYLARDGALMAVAVKRGSAALEFDPPQRLFALPASYVSSYAYHASADGQRFLTLAAFRKQAREPLTVVVNWPALLKQSR